MDEPPPVGLQPCRFKRGENSRFQGMLYQTNLTTFCLIQAIKRLEDWMLSAENVEADKFDDVVIESSTGVFLMQAKYKNNEDITSKDLFSTNPKDDSFALAKYFQSFQRIKAKFQVTDLAICTNANMVANTIRKDFLISKNATSDSVLYYQGRDCTFYTFNECFMPVLKGLILEYLKNSKTKNTDTDIFTDEDIIEFLRYFRLYHDYPCQTELINAMEQSLPLVRLSHNVLKKVSVQDLMFKVIEWYGNPRGDCEYLTEFRLKTMFSELTHTVSTSVEQRKFKKGGDVGITSLMFHFELITITLLKALETFRWFRLSFKNLQADKFDNILLEWYGGNLAIQTKYKQNKKVTFDELLSVGLCNNGFSLPKYFLSYQKVTPEFQELDVVICTNANITLNRGVQKYLKKQNASPESLLYSGDRECSFYTFEETVIPLLQKHIREYFKNLTNNNDTIDEELITDENIKDFLGHVQFHSDYPLDVKGDIDDSLRRLSSSSDIFSNVTHQDIIYKVMEWFQQSREECEYITENLALTMFSEIKSNKFRDKLDQYNVLFTNNDLMFDEKKTIFYVPFERAYLLPVIKIFRVLQANNLKALYVDPDSDTVVQKHFLKAFEHPSYNYLIVVWEEILHHKVLFEMYTKLRNSLIKYEYKKVVLVAKKDALDTKIFETINVRVGFTDFLKDTRSSLLNKRNIVLDKSLTSVKEILDSKTHNHFVMPPDILHKLIRDEDIAVTVYIYDMDVNGVNQKILMLTEKDSELMSPMNLTEESQGLVFELK